MNREVFLSILAMDSYQRGYAEGIIGVGGTKIGNATIGPSSNISDDSPEVAAGFYALSYTLDSAWAVLAAGTKVISYRGTDFDAANGGAILDGEFIKDLRSGWSTFTGLGNNSQFPLAEAFFKAVTGNEGRVGKRAAPANTNFTGHSLYRGVHLLHESSFPSNCAKPRSSVRLGVLPPLRGKKSEPISAPSARSGRGPWSAGTAR